MKSFYYSCLLLLASFTSFGQIIAFTDANFKSALVNTLCVTSYNGSSYITGDADTNNDNEIDVSEAEAVTFLNVSNQSITSVEGLSYFRNLNSFNCCNNLITSIDLSSLNVLNTFSCNDNLFSEINLCGTAVIYFECINNPNLTYISIKNNAISYVIAGRNPALEPPIGSLSFSNCPLLTTICYDEAELHAVQYEMALEYIHNVTLITDCVLDCVSLQTQHFDTAAHYTLTPNPAQSTINITSSTSATIAAISVYNTLGKVVLSRQSTINTHSISIDVSILNAGTYFVEISFNQGSSTQKFIKL